MAQRDKNEARAPTRPSQPKSRGSAPAKATGTTFVAPDPLAVVLPALCALGPIAGIGVMDLLAQEPDDGRKRTRGKPAHILRDLVGCCRDLEGLFKRIAQHPSLFAAQMGAGSAQAKFGMVGQRVTSADLRLAQACTDDVARLLVQAVRASGDVMGAIEDGQVIASEAVFDGFSQQQERLNAMLARREPLPSLIGGGFEIAGALLALSRQLEPREPR